MSSASLDSLTLTPEFDSDIYEYTVETTDDSNTWMVTKSDETAVVTVYNNGEEKGSIPSGTKSAYGDETWVEGLNVIKLLCTNGTTVRTYTINITKTS